MTGLEVIVHKSKILLQNLTSLLYESCVAIVFDKHFAAAAAVLLHQKEIKIQIFLFNIGKDIKNRIVKIVLQYTLERQ